MPQKRSSAASALSKICISEKQHSQEDLSETSESDWVEDDSTSESNSDSSLHTKNKTHTDQPIQEPPYDSDPRSGGGLITLDHYNDAESSDISEGELERLMFGIVERDPSISRTRFKRKKARKTPSKLFYRLTVRFSLFSKPHGAIAQKEKEIRCNAKQSLYTG